MNAKALAVVLAPVVAATGYWLWENYFHYDEDEEDEE